MRYQKVRRTIRRRQSRLISSFRDLANNLDKFVVGRFGHLKVVRKFLLSWMLFWLSLAFITVWQMVNLSGYFQHIEPVSGGIYNEGILGTLSNVNPIYATSNVDSSLSRLIFAGLFTYNQHNQLVGCLAGGYSISTNGRVYTVKLRPGLTWQDGRPLTAADVVFTFDTIQNPNAQSPLYSSWQNVKVAAPNSLTVTFTLKNPLASFPYSLTVGIIPKHILGGVNPVDLRSQAFNNTDPIGAGPFAWQQIQVNGNTPENASETIALSPFRHYVLGKPKLAEFIVNAIANKQQLINEFTANQLNGIAGLNSVPRQIAKHKGYIINSPLLTAGNYVFFKTSSGVLGNAVVRKALVLASNPQSIIASLGYATKPVNEPLLIGQLGYNPKYAQLTNQLSQAKALLNQNGWIVGRGNIRYKGSQQLAFNLVTTNIKENRQVASELKSQWSLLGANVSLVSESAQTYQTALEGHNYDSTLNGISIGVDPDVFAYWDGSQFDPRSSGLNLSEYNNSNANQALEAGRTRLDPALRVIKYQPFLADWQADAPALGLYQPRALYITRQPVYGLSNHPINTPEDRYDNIVNWKILTAAVTD